MVFAGEASWRWRMMLPVRPIARYEYFWRQAARWLARTSARSGHDCGAGRRASRATPSTIGVDVRDARSRRSPTRPSTRRSTSPGGKTAAADAPARAGNSGRFTAAIRPEQPGSVPGAGRGAARRRRSAQPTLVLRRRRRPRVRRSAAERRLAPPTRAGVGGRYVRAADVCRDCRRGSRAPSRTAAEPERRELWHEPWAFALVDRRCCRPSGCCAGAGDCDEAARLLSDSLYSRLCCS